MVRTPHDVPAYSTVCSYQYDGTCVMYPSKTCTYSLVHTAHIYRNGTWYSTCLRLGISVLAPCHVLCKRRVSTSHSSGGFLVIMKPTELLSVDDVCLSSSHCASLSTYYPSTHSRAHPVSVPIIYPSEIFAQWSQNHGAEIGASVNHVTKQSIA